MSFDVTDAHLDGEESHSSFKEANMFRKSVSLQLSIYFQFQLNMFSNGLKHGFCKLSETLC